MKNIHLGLFVIIVFVSGAIVSPLSASAQIHQQVITTDAGTLKIGISTDPLSPKSGEQSKLKIEFLNSQTSTIQEHIDYTVLVTNDGSSVFGPIPLTHTSLGTATIPIQFKDGENKIVIDIQGILFRPIPSEKAIFSITIGDKQNTSSQLKIETKTTEKSMQQKQTDKPKSTSPSNENKSKNSKVTSVTKDKKDLKKDNKQLSKPKYEDIKKKSTESKKKNSKKTVTKATKSD